MIAFSAKNLAVREVSIRHKAVFGHGHAVFAKRIFYIFAHLAESLDYFRWHDEIFNLIRDQENHILSPEKKFPGPLQILQFKVF